MAELSQEQRYRKYILPALGILETIATKGKSPGSTALQQEGLFQQREDREFQAKKFDQELKRQAMQDRLSGFQIGEYERKEKSDVEDKMRKEALRLKVSGIVDEYKKTPEYSKLQPEDKAFLEADPEKFFEYKVKPKADPYALIDYRFGKEQPYKEKVFETGKEEFKANQEDKMRKEYSDLSEDFENVSTSYQSLKNLAKDATGSSDIAMIFNFMKTNDPRSTVRQEEQATAQNAGGVPENVRLIYNKLLAGEKLTPKVRQDFVHTAETLYKTRKTKHDRRLVEMKKIAQNRGFDPNNIFISYGAIEEPSIDTPPPQDKASRLQYLRDKKAGRVQ